MAIRSFPRSPVALMIGAAVVLSACASGAGEGAVTSDASPSGSTATNPPFDALEILETLHPDRGEPPSELELTDLVVGDGPAVTAGQTATVQYWGLRWSDGGTFDASWTRGTPFSFRLDAGQVIRGWDLGVDGMQVGGRRVLVIPPALAYGERGAGDRVGPGETLVFIVDLVEVSAS